MKVFIVFRRDKAYEMTTSPAFFSFSLLRPPNVETVPLELGDRKARTALHEAAVGHVTISSTSTNTR